LEELEMKKIPKQVYTTEFKELADLADATKIS
jgi:hypothetical protein